LSPRPFRLALVAHDAKKAEMADFVAAHREAMRGFELTATGTTGARIIERSPDLFVARVKSGPLGGDQQIGALIAEGRIDALIFFVDPLSPHPHDVDVKALTRLGLVYDISMALTGPRRNGSCARSVMLCRLTTSSSAEPKTRAEDPTGVSALAEQVLFRRAVLGSRFARPRMTARGEYRPRTAEIRHVVNPCDTNDSTDSTPARPRPS